MEHLNFRIKAFWGIYMLFFTLGLVSCNDNDDATGDRIWDFNNTTILIKVQNAQGVDLLNPQESGNITGNTIKAIYNNKVYVLDADVSLPQTKSNMPKWSGLYTYENKGNYYLAFGEFSPENDYHGESFTIDWGDGTVDNVSFDFFITWKKKEPTVHFANYINGKEVKEVLITK